VGQDLNSAHSTARPAQPYFAHARIPTAVVRGAHSSVSPRARVKLFRWRVGIACQVLLLCGLRVREQQYGRRIRAVLVVNTAMVVELIGGNKSGRWGRSDLIFPIA
jgi:hypothetical protein